MHYSLFVSAENVPLISPLWLRYFPSFSREYSSPHCFYDLRHFPGKIKVQKWWRGDSMYMVEQARILRRQRLWIRTKKKLSGKWDLEECWYRRGLTKQRLRYRIFGFGSLMAHSDTRSRSVLWRPSVRKTGSRISLSCVFLFGYWENC